MKAGCQADDAVHAQIQTYTHTHMRTLIYIHTRSHTHTRQGSTTRPGPGKNNKILGCPRGVAQSWSGYPGNIIWKFAEYLISLKI